MPELRVIEGRLSEHYNHFAEYKIESCTATATRLMGVVALKITWRGRSKQRNRYWQIIHLDYSEYGIDEYKEFEGIPGSDKFSENKEEMNNSWKNLISGMGGDLVELTPDAMLKLVEMALPLAGDNIDREYDNQENIRFRHYAVMRLELMMEALAQDGITAGTCTARQAIAATSPARLATCETINYFIMRLVDHDYDAAACLTSIKKKELMVNPLTEPGIQTLIRSSITKSSAETDPPADGSSHPYRVRITTLARNGYYHSSFVIWLSGNYKARNPKVTDIEIGSMVKLSEFESAIQVTRREYITVFECPDRLLDGFNGSLISTLEGVEPEIVPNGWLYTIYKRNNSHVNKTEYRIGDDVYGYALLSFGGQFIVMSNEVEHITAIDSAVLFSFYSPYLECTGRYLLEKTPVFHTICHTHGALFEDFIMPAPES